MDGWTVPRRAAVIVVVAFGKSPHAVHSVLFPLSVSVRLSVGLSVRPSRPVRARLMQSFVSPGYANGEGGPLHLGMSTETMLAVFVASLLVGWTVILQAGLVRRAAENDLTAA